MAKGKSSASSATRKKHARKAVTTIAPPEEPAIPKEKKPKGKEKKGKEPKKKVYIPPVKFAPVQPDPLDTLGLAQRLSPELLVVLRRLAKKDSTTKRRALEELQSSWVDKARNDSFLLLVLAETVPVWFHHVPALFLHPSRRIRLLAASLHSSLLRLPSPVLDQLLLFVREVAPAAQAEHILGSWCMAAHDADRQVSALARETWNSSISLSDDSGKKLVLDSGLLSHLWEFIQRTILDPGGVYAYVNPPQPTVASPIPQRQGAGQPSPPKRDEEGSVRAKTEDDDEGESDRNARLRVGAFGAAEWVLNSMIALRAAEVTDEFLAPFANPALWSSLYHAQIPPFVECEAYGQDQPTVRRAAWQLMLDLVRACQNQMKMMLPALSSAVLRSAWVEPDPNVRGMMWQPLLTFLRGFPESWELDASSEKAVRDADDDDGEDSEDGLVASQPHSSPLGARMPASQAYREFLRFLGSGCSGSPLQGYPAVLIVLSTIPAAIFASSSSGPPLSELFGSFWAALDGRALSSLDRVATSAAFLSSILECLVFLLRRLLKSTPEQASLLAHGELATGTDNPRTRDGVAHGLVREQITRVWDELSSRRLKVEGMAAAALVVHTLTSLYQLDKGLFRTAWDAVSSGIKSQFNSENAAVSPLVSTMLNTFRTNFEAGSEAESLARTLTSEVVQATIQQCEGILDSDDTPSQERVVSLVDIVDRFGGSLFSDPEVAQSIDEIMRRHYYRLLVVSPSLLLVYFSLRQDEKLIRAAWHDILLSVASHQDEVGAVLLPLLDAAEKGMLPEYLRPQADELDNLTGGLLAEALSGPPGTMQVSIIRKILCAPEHFVSEGCFQGLAQSLSSAFTLHFRGVVHDDEAVSLDAFDVPLDLIHALTAKWSSSPPPEIFASLIPDIFLFAYLLPLVQPVAPQQRLMTSQIWEVWMAEAQQDARANMLVDVKQRLRELFADCSVRPSPEHILQLLAGPHPGLHVDLMSDILPTKDTLDAMLSRLPSTPADLSLAVVDPLVPPASLCKAKHVSEQPYDADGLSEYARAVNGLLRYLAEDRHVAKEHVWALRHFLALYLYADERLRIPFSKSGVFAGHMSGPSLQEITNKVLQVTTYILSLLLDEGWHMSVTKALVAEQADAQLDNVGRLVFELVSYARREDNVRESRILHIILQHILGNASKAEADQWMTVVRRFEKLAPHTSLAILSAVTRYAPEPPLLDRYRNELAAGMIGIRPSKANTDGLWLLRRLAISAPDPDSDVVFLSQPRAVNLMKACQQWVTSEEDLSEEVESEMTHVFLHLAPILQNVPGAHWDLIFDVVENNLENSSFSEPSTLVTLSRTLRLIIAVQDLTSTNRSLRAVWEERQTACLTLIRDLVAIKLDPSEASAPLSVSRELALQIVQDLPASLIDETTLQKICHVVTDTSFDVQKMAYRLLHEAARKYTEHMVIEAAVDSEAVVKPELPLELLDILQQSLSYEEGEQDGQGLSGYLLAWMITFDLFANASLKVKSGYIEQLRNLDLVTQHLLPNILSILGLYGGLANAFKLNLWIIDEYYLDSYAHSPLSLRLLAAHLYYRAHLLVPSLIRDWLFECRDRQLLNAVTSYTSNYFSPAIIRAELELVKDPAVAVDLIDENLKVKVAFNVNEVTASYAVDEHRIEFMVKLPPDYPLHGIEVRGTNRVGVSPERWRAWVLGVQQILTTRNGNIVDGLSFFKKNIASYFAGVAECPICYSVISASDGNLPRKTCRTCKNLFHAGCLYQWFNTSHSSSCPLCRSEII